MKRDYTDGVVDNADFFIGTEVEHTPAYKQRTLFVVGVKTGAEIQARALAYKCTHIYFGANQSFNPKNAEEFADWVDMISLFLRSGYLCTLDFDVKHAEMIAETKMAELTTFIPQISVKMPYVKLFNLNATLKIDDVDFKATNPGVWCHSLSDLTGRKNFTDWSQYTKDEIIK